MSRQKVHVRERPGESPFWWYDFRVGTKRFRGPTEVLAGSANEAAALRAATALWLAESDRQGTPPDRSAVAEVDTTSLIQSYASDELARLALRRHDRYSQEIVTALNVHVAERFATVGEITAQAWERAQGELHGDGWSLRTCQRVTTHLRRFLRYCQRIGALSEAPKLTTATNEEVAAEAESRRALTKAERTRFLEAVGQLDARAHRVYTVLFYTCLRKGGLEALRARWIDWRRGFVTFPRGVLKNRRGLRLFLHPLARRAIRLEMKTSGKSDDEPVFGFFDYGRGQDSVFWRAVRRARIPEHDLVPHHVTRHTAATIAGLDGASLGELMDLGGWKTPAMAMRYMHLDGGLSRKAVGRL